jgi:uncharacterized membrane protein YbaN (DUF454 family)
MDSIDHIIATNHQKSLFVHSKERAHWDLSFGISSAEPYIVAAKLWFLHRYFAKKTINRFMSNMVASASICYPIERFLLVILVAFAKKTDEYDGTKSRKTWFAERSLREAHSIDHIIAMHRQKSLFVYPKERAHWDLSSKTLKHVVAIPSAEMRSIDNVQKKTINRFMTNIRTNECLYYPIERFLLIILVFFTAKSDEYYDTKREEMFCERRPSKIHSIDHIVTMRRQINLHKYLKKQAHCVLSFELSNAESCIVAAKLWFLHRYSTKKTINRFMSDIVTTMCLCYPIERFLLVILVIFARKSNEYYDMKMLKNVFCGARPSKKTVSIEGADHHISKSSLLNLKPPPFFLSVRGSIFSKCEDGLDRPYHHNASSNKSA